MIRNQEKLEHALKRYAAIQQFKTSEAYGLLVEPLKQELEALKASYDCETLADIKFLKGKREGLSLLLDLLNQIEEEGVRAKELQARILVRTDVEIDSTDL